MSSQLNLWNLALSHLGNKAGLSSVVAPYASREAELCAQFWDIARRAALQKNKPSWARKRKALATVDLGDDQPAQWAFAYTLPSDCLQLLGVFDPNRLYDEDDAGEDIETSQADDTIVYTSVEQAIGRYIADMPTTGRYSPMFTLGLSYLLASMVGGALIKGKEGAATAQGLAKTAWSYLAIAEADDANQRQRRDVRDDAQHKAPWLDARDFTPDLRDAVIVRDED